MKLGVYGTLRDGHGNNLHMLRGESGVRHVGRNVMLPGYTMSTFGGYPAIFAVSSKEYMVTLDVYDITEADPSVLRRIDGMEIGAGYTRETALTLAGEEVEVYVMGDEDKPFFPEAIPSGDWNDYCDRRYG